MRKLLFPPPQQNLGTSDTDTYQKTTTVSNTTDLASTKLKKEIDALTERKNDNYANMEKIEKEIENLIRQAEEKIYEATQKSEKTIKEHEETSKQIVREQFNAYIRENKNGKGMTKETLDKNIKVALPNVPELADAVSALTDAHGLVDEIDSYLIDFNLLESKTQIIEDTIELKETEYISALETETSTDENSVGNTILNFGLSLVSSLKNYIEKADSYEEQSASLKTEINEEYQNIGLTSQEMKDFSETLLTTCKS